MAITDLLAVDLFDWEVARLIEIARHRRSENLNPSDGTTAPMPGAPPSQSTGIRSLRTHMRRQICIPVRWPRWRWPVIAATVASGIGELTDQAILLTGADPAKRGQARCLAPLSQGGTPRNSPVISRGVRNCWLFSGL